MKVFYSVNQTLLCEVWCWSLAKASCLMNKSKKFFFFFVLKNFPKSERCLKLFFDPNPNNRKKNVIIQFRQRQRCG